MIAKTIARTSGIASATTVPARTPRLTKLTPRMMATACQSEVVKSVMASSTVTGWSATRVASMPIGSSVVIAVMACLTFLPRVRMSPPSRITIARPRAGLPLTRNIGCGGSA